MTGKTIAHYRILEKLGEGGMGVVYKAEDSKLRRTVALKLLPAHLGEHRERFVREAQAAGALNHPNICTVHEIDEGYPYLAMEFLDGVTLKDRIADRPLPLGEALDIAIQTCAGLDHAHEKGVVHRDIKPGNLMVCPNGRVKIMDFGLAQIGDRTRITKTGTSLGTPAYMSPEQVRGEDAGKRSDIWSVGVVLYEMVTGRTPFAGSSEQAVSYGIVHTEPEPPTALRSGLPVAVDRIVAKALAKDAERRYQNMADLAVDLRALTKAGATAGVPAKERRRWLAGAVAAVVVAAGCYFGWRGYTASPVIRSLTILPLRMITQEAGESFLGLGVADALITKIGQSGQVQVRPVGAVRRYAKGDNDPIEAARQLNTDAVLEGSLQQSGARLRVSMHLLRTGTGETLWTQVFDVAAGEVFAMQDDIAKQVAGQLRLKLDAGQQQDLVKRHTSNPQAFELYSKALHHLANAIRGNQNEMAVELLKRAIELDPGYALAHAQLGYAAAKLCLYEVEDTKYLELARRELLEAEKLDPKIAQIHVARGSILYSRYGNWNLREAILEMKIARTLDPNVGHKDLSYLFWHTGLEELGKREDELSLAAQPNSLEEKTSSIENFYIVLRVDEGADLQRRFFNRDPDVRYYLAKGMTDEAERLVQARLMMDHNGMLSRVFQAQVLAMKGKRSEARESLRSIEPEAEKLPRLMPYHHTSYGIAQARALLGDAAEAAHWLQVTVDTGWPQYPMMERDRMLDPVRKDPAVAKVLAAVKLTWEGYKREFGSEGK